ncbi:hypothetical protein HPB50_021080 [Hyalomma asiaticum]|uniref:Uncharacterized protein n=1 Tax=Hyalomma asiaticum TaxID=266040 RepID=A0ACB7T6M1_HYAAI|nr:hypothetical protein HPB50_021080 [Hyalomma asiaticum]
MWVTFAQTAEYSLVLTKYVLPGEPPVDLPVNVATDKLQILQCLDSGQRQVDVAKEYGIAPTTLSTIVVKQKSKLEGETSFNPTRKRLCTGHSKAADDAVAFGTGDYKRHASSLRGCEPVGLRHSRMPVPLR